MIYLTCSSEKEPIENIVRGQALSRENLKGDWTNLLSVKLDFYTAILAIWYQIDTFCFLLV